MVGSGSMLPVASSSVRDEVYPGRGNLVLPYRGLSKQITATLPCDTGSRAPCQACRPLLRKGKATESQPGRSRYFTESSSGKYLCIRQVEKPRTGSSEAVGVLHTNNEDETARALPRPVDVERCHRSLSSLHHENHIRSD